MIRRPSLYAGLLLLLLLLAGGVSLGKIRCLGPTTNLNVLSGNLSSWPIPTRVSTPESKIALATTVTGYSGPRAGSYILFDMTAMPYSEPRPHTIPDHGRPPGVLSGAFLLNGRISAIKDHFDFCKAAAIDMATISPSITFGSYNISNVAGGILVITETNASWLSRRHDSLCSIALRKLSARIPAFTASFSSRAARSFASAAWIMAREARSVASANAMSARCCNSPAWRIAHAANIISKNTPAAISVSAAIGPHVWNMDSPIGRKTIASQTSIAKPRKTPTPLHWDAVSYRDWPRRNWPSSLLAGFIIPTRFTRGRGPHPILMLVIVSSIIVTLTLVHYCFPGF